MAKQIKMKLLKDITLYCIKVDYFMYNAETDEEYTEPTYLSIDTETKNKNGECMNLLVFENTIQSNLRVFDTKKEADEYFKLHDMANSFCYENARVVKLTYDMEKGWVE